MFSVRWEKKGAQSGEGLWTPRPGAIRTRTLDPETHAVFAGCPGDLSSLKAKTVTSNTSADTYLGDLSIQSLPTPVPSREGRFWLRCLIVLFAETVCKPFDARERSVSGTPCFVRM